ncbi:BA14K family protein [Pseudorhodoplanes sinuspersici]|uniref:Lectin-like protein BA14k n=1 Tax=Pseudorhodoplanes sinuspersici TaxID=1235591 RepID=A0A1W6ZPN8_9HYPH|nr:BA14K family protein [Pseudorhodoplanes sinuspersici]ARP99207.1 hypothetical protein CAK95_08990 [Pseudorhodoplanes sinuspersici]RKE69130.1 BA14K-like protein [Pseudorhodoplanes sinuspersici]
MTVLKSLTLSALAVAGALAVSPASAAPVMRGIAPAASTQNEMVQHVQWRRHGYYGGRRGYYYGGPRYYRRNNSGAVAAGVLGGLAVGAMIGAAAASAPPPPAYAPAPVYGGNDWLAYCSSKYRSFDPASGTYLGYDGLRHPCQ